MTITVGIRDLKNRLSEHLRRVRSGDTILITDRGEVVAEICPPGQPKYDHSLPSGLVELARRGLATLGGPNDPSAYARPKRLLTWKEVAELLDEVRGPR
jgi:prevent-host-death family protein